jgi:hypothetical protein
VLTIQHKYYARQAFERILPGTNPPLRAPPPQLQHPGRRPHPVPVLHQAGEGPRTRCSPAAWTRTRSCAGHTAFGWFERAIIERLVKPFNDVMRAHSTFEEEPFSMIAEGILHGRQVTANGYARDGKVTMLGTVDSVMYPGTDHFQRFQYPSSLPPDTLARIDQTAIKLLEGLGFQHGVFNIELRIDPSSARCA